MFLSVYLLLGAIIFGSDQEVREVMRAVRRNNATGMFSWIGSDGWSARNLVSDGNEPEVSILFLFFKFFISSSKIFEPSRNVGNVFTIQIKKMFANFKTLRISLI